MAKQMTGSIIDPKKAKKYHVSDKVRTTSGRKAIDNDDAVARKLRGKSHEELAAVAKAEDLGDRWREWNKSLNPGQCRMALGNAMRAKLRAKSRPKSKTKKAA